jgi:hypothetical protein
MLCVLMRALSLSLVSMNAGLMPYEPDQMIINHYSPGQGIHPHVDKIHCFEGVVGSLGLGSSCIMAFKYARSRVPLSLSHFTCIHHLMSAGHRRHVETGRRVDVFFERRTALMLTGEARYEWTHGTYAGVARNAHEHAPSELTESDLLLMMMPGIAADVADTWKGVQFKRKNRISLTWRKVILPPAKSDASSEPRPQSDAPTSDDAQGEQAST